MAEEEQESKESKLSALKQNKMILFVIIGVVVLLLIVLILVAVLIFSGGNEEEMQAQATAPTEQLQSASNRGSVANPNSSLLSIGTMYPVDQFIVNLMSSGGGKRYLKTSIALELSVSEMTAELDTKRDIIRDVLITILSSKTFEEVQTSKGKQKLKEEIIERLNEFLVDGRVANVFFTEFVVQ